jgi:protoporphyrinogen oxidase
MIHIIGGGIGGLSLAYYLLKNGKSVTVYEASDKLGGNCSWTTIGNNIVDSYYHVLTSMDASLQEIMIAVGADKLLFPVKTSMAFHKNGRTYPVTNVLEAISFPPVKFYDRLMLIRCFLISMMIKDWSKLDSTSAKEWLSRIGSSTLYENFWKPIMNHKFGQYSDLVVATDMWFRLNRLFFTSKNIGKKGAYYIKGSFKTFFDLFETYLLKHNVVIQRNSRVTGISIVDGAIESIEIGHGKPVPANLVVATVPIPQFTKLFSVEFHSYVEQLRRIVYLDNVCLIVKTDIPICRHYQLAVSDPDMPFTGIISAEQFYPPKDYGGYITYITKYTQSSSKSPQIQSAGKLLEEYLPYLQKINPVLQQHHFLDLQLIVGKDVEAVHTLHYSSIRPPHQTPVKNLWLLNTAQIYPEPTVLDTASLYAKLLTEKILAADNVVTEY